jgi:hypothetical protein
MERTPEGGRKEIDALLAEYLGDAANDPDLQEAKEGMLETFAELLEGESELRRAETAAAAITRLRRQL